MKTKIKLARFPLPTLLLGFSLLLLSLVLGGCAPAATPAAELEAPIEPATVPPGTDVAQLAVEEPLSIVDGLGRTVEFESPPQRIVSIAPSNTEILFAIGAADQMVGRDEYSDFPPEALELTSIGDTYGALNTEAIIVLDPDLNSCGRDHTDRADRCAYRPWTQGFPGAEPNDIR